MSRREQYVWRVVIDHKPDAPKDLDQWMANCAGWFMFRDSGYDVDDPNVPDPEDFTEENTLKAWSWWTAESRMRFLSRGTADSKIVLLKEHGIDAHLERGTISYERWPRVCLHGGKTPNPKEQR